MNNRAALTSLKGRYAGEIGRLEEADKALQEERAYRKQLYAKDPSMLYATDNLKLSNFLNRDSSKLYSVSGNDLYNRGMLAGKAASARVYNVGDGGATLGGYYRDWVERVGYTPEVVAAF